MRNASKLLSRTRFVYDPKSVLGKSHLQKAERALAACPLFLPTPLWIIQRGNRVELKPSGFKNSRSPPSHHQLHAKSGRVTPVRPDTRLRIPAWVCSVFTVLVPRIVPSNFPGFLDSVKALARTGGSIHFPLQFKPCFATIRARCSLMAAVTKIQVSIQTVSMLPGPPACPSSPFLRRWPLTMLALAFLPSQTTTRRVVDIKHSITVSKERLRAQAPLLAQAAPPSPFP